VLSNGFMLDEGGSAVADAARTYHFANPLEGRTVADLPDVPLFLIRSGRDESAGVNDTIDLFVAAALRRNLPLLLVNHAAAPHAFEIQDDTEVSRWVVRQALAFLMVHLGIGAADDGPDGSTEPRLQSLP
jgi:hypothetical protein